MTCTAIGFDYNGVINGLPGWVFRQRFCELMGISDNCFGEAYFSYNKRVNRGEITWKDFWMLVLADLGKPAKLGDVMRLQADPVWNELNRDVLDLIDALRSKGYKTGLLSNATPEDAHAMRNSGIDKHFDVFHVSAETGFVKPEPTAFMHLAESLQAQTSELIFVDDTAKSLSTAREVGFTPVLFASYEQLVQRLTELKVL